MNRSVCLTIIAASLLLCVEGHADKATARKIFVQAEAKFQDRQYRSALALYKKAYHNAPLAGFHFNIAQCHRMLGQHEQAVHHFEQYLSEAKNPRNRKAAQRLLRLSRQKLKPQERSDQADSLADTQTGDAEPVPGVTESPEVEKKPAIKPEPVPPSDQKRLHRVYFWSSAAASASLLLTGAITGALALSRSSEFRDPATAYEDLQSLKDSGEALRTTSTVTFAIGSAFAVCTALLYFYTDFKPRETKVSLMPVGEGAAVMLMGRY